MWSYDFSTNINKLLENPRTDYDEYIENPVSFENINTVDVTADVEIEMTRPIDEMRSEFNKTTRRLRKLFSLQESVLITTKPLRAHQLMKRHATV